MKQCPTCKKKFAHNFKFCPVHGRPLWTELPAENLSQSFHTTLLEDVPPKPKIFVSYRREDSEADTGRLYDLLSNHFGQTQIFVDIDTIEIGEDFVEVIERGVIACQILIAVIGKNWLTVTDSSGNRRIDSSEDFVNLEIATAFECNIPVIPVLVQGASMPQLKDLPKTLSKLARRNGLELSHKRWGHDANQLIKAIEKRLGMSNSPTAA